MRRARLLVPVDFSDHARRAARVALRLARRSGAEVTLLHIDSLPEVALLSAEPFYIAPQTWELLKGKQSERIDEHLAALVAELTPEARGALKTSQQTAHDVVSGITTFAEADHSDLIVIGSHGAGAARRLLFGSVAAKVAKVAPCPVLVTRPGRADDVAERGFQRALVGVDYSRFSPAAALAAAALLDPAPPDDGEGEPAPQLHLLHVWQEPPLFAVERSVEHDQREYLAGVERARAHEVQRMRGFVANCQLGVETASYVETGSPAHLLLEQAETLDVDVIAVGAHGRHSALEKVLGTVCDQILRHAEIPVLMIPAGALDRPAEG